MKQTLMSVFFTFAWLSCSNPTLAAPSDAKPLTVAVLDFESSGDKLKGLGSDAAQLLAARLSASPSLMILERQEIEKLLGEIELGQGGAIPLESAGKIGQMLGAQILVTGRVFQAGENYYIVAKIIGVETSRVYGETTTFKDTNLLGTSVEALGKKIENLLVAKGETFLGQSETEEQFLARLKGRIRGKKLPILGVAVTEQHLGRPVPDPAVQTEFLRIYQKLGGKISLDMKTAKVWISGEAFSERGMQRGSLVACRARVEITIRNTGDDVTIDRQTSSSMGLGEMTSSKEALEKAARILLERNLDKITQ